MTSHRRRGLEQKRLAQRLPPHSKSGGGGDCPSLVMEPSQPFPIPGLDDKWRDAQICSSPHGSSKESNTNHPSSVEWPSDCYIEQPRAIHQDWHINTEIDLNLEYSVQNQLNMDCHVQQREEMDEMHAFESPQMNASKTSFFEDLVYESHSSEQSSYDGEDVLQAHLEGDTDVEELFPVPDEEELVEDPKVDKAAMIRKARSKDAKAKAIKIRQVKQRAAAGTVEDAFVLSDSCSDDNKEILDLDDDDGAVLESKISVRKRKSRAMPVKKRTCYDESKSSAHEQFALDLCFHDVTQLRKALDNYHIAQIRNFTYSVLLEPKILLHGHVSQSTQVCTR